MGTENKEDLVSTMVSSVTIAILGCSCEFVFFFFRKKIHAYTALVVLHISNRILGILSPGYPGNKNQILMLMKV